MMIKNLIMITNKQVLAVLTIFGGNEKSANAKPQFPYNPQPIRPTISPYNNPNVQPNAYYGRPVAILRQNHVQDISGAYDFR